MTKNTFAEIAANHKKAADMDARDSVLMSVVTFHETLLERRAKVAGMIEENRESDDQFTPVFGTVQPTLELITARYDRLIAYVERITEEHQDDEDLNEFAKLVYKAIDAATQVRNLEQYYQKVVLILPVAIVALDKIFEAYVPDAAPEEGTEPAAPSDAVNDRQA